MAKITMFFDNDDGELFTEEWAVQDVKDMVVRMLKDFGNRVPQFTVVAESHRDGCCTQITATTKDGKKGICHIAFMFGMYHCEPYNTPFFAK